MTMCISSPYATSRDSGSNVGCITLELGRQRFHIAALIRDLAPAFIDPIAQVIRDITERISIFVVPVGCRTTFHRIDPPFPESGKVIIWHTSCKYLQNRERGELTRANAQTSDAFEATKLSSSKSSGA